MVFTDIWFMWGLGALALPIVIHLLVRARCKQVDFSSISFIIASREQVSKVSRLYNLLLLLLRCTIIALVITAFAGPAILAGKSAVQTKPLYFIAIDNTLSTSLEIQEHICAFDEIKEKTREYVNAVGSDGKFCVYTFTSGLIASDINKAGALALVNAVEIEAGMRDISELIDELNVADQDTRDLHIFLASDFWPSVTRRLAKVKVKIAAGSFVFADVTAMRKIRNVAIVGAGVEDKNAGSLRCWVLVANRGQTIEQRKLNLSCSGQKLFETDFTLFPEEQKLIHCSAEVEPLVLPSTQCLPFEFMVMPDDMLCADDIYRVGLSFSQSQTVKVLLVGDDDRQLILPEAALLSLENCTSTKKIKLSKIMFKDYTPQSLHGCDMVVFSYPSPVILKHKASLRQFINSGGNVFFFLRPYLDTDVINRLYRESLIPAKVVNSAADVAFVKISLGATDRLTREFDGYDFQNLLFDKAYRLKLVDDSDTLLNFDDGTAFICRLKNGNGYSTIINTSLDNSMSSLAKTNFWPVFSRWLFTLQQETKAFTYAASENVRFAVDRDINSVSVTDTRGAIHELQVADRKVELPPNGKTGWITVRDPQLWLGVNPDEDETAFAQADKDQIKNLLATVFVSPQKNQRAEQRLAADEYLELWKYMIFAGLVLFFIEQLLSSRIERV